MSFIFLHFDETKPSLTEAMGVSYERMEELTSLAVRGMKQGKAKDKVGLCDWININFTPRSPEEIFLMGMVVGRLFALETDGKKKR